MSRDKEVPEQQWERTMSLYGKLLGRQSVEEDEFTDTSRWPESGAQGVTQNWLDDYIFDEEPLFVSTPGPNDLD